MNGAIKHVLMGVVFGLPVAGGVSEAVCDNCEVQVVPVDGETGLPVIPPAPVAAPPQVDGGTDGPAADGS